MSQIDSRIFKMAGANRGSNQSELSSANMGEVLNSIHKAISQIDIETMYNQMDEQGNANSEKIVPDALMEK